MSSLSENKIQEVPDAFLSLMAALSKYDETKEANNIISRYKSDKSDKRRITELQKLLESAPGKLKERLDRTVLRVVNRVDFTRLKLIMRTQDILARRSAVVELLEDYGMDYREESV